MADDTHDQDQEQAQRWLESKIFMNPDRKRGILTQHDRELLVERVLQGGNNEMNTQQLRDARYRIRNRIKAALFDIQLLALRYPMEEYASILESIQENADDYGVSPHTIINLLLHFGVYFSRVGIDNGYVLREGSGGDRELEAYLQQLLRSAILHAEERKVDEQTVTDVDVDISIRRTQFEQEPVLQELVFGTPTHEQFFFYTRHGDMARLQELLRKHDTEIVIRSDTGEERRISPDDSIIDDFV